MSEFIDTSVFFKEQLDRANEMIKALATELENTQETNVRLQKAVYLAVALAEETIEDIEDEGMCSDEYQKRLSEIKQLIKGE